MPQVWNTWAMFFQLMASRWIPQMFNKSSIDHNPRTSKPFNPFLALPISIVVSLKITSLTSLLKKDSPFIFNEEALSQFQILKEDFTAAPILSHFNPSLPTILETNTSDYALGAVLSQVLKDHNSLQYFLSSKFLTCHHARWGEFPSQFYFTITYCPGRLATLPDCVSLHDNMYPERNVDFIRNNPQSFHQVIKQDGIQESIFFSIKAKLFSDLVEQIQKEVWKDKDYKEILKQLERGESVSDYTPEPQSKLLLFKHRVVIPRNEELQLNILQKHHDSPLACHPGQEKTLKLIKSDFYWSGMNQFIKDYVSSFQQCLRNKNIHHKKFGLLKPIQIPYGPWSSLLMYFITQSHLSNKFDSILVAVERFSKMEIFIPTYGTITSLDLAQIFIDHLFSKHGLPASIVSDRGSLFLSLFWTQLCQKLKISRDLSTAFHPEADGQTERVNQILEQYLWMYVSYHQDDWHTWLSLAEFAYNNAEHSSTKQSPFLTIYGRIPSLTQSIFLMAHLLDRYKQNSNQYQ
ncbi:hypothetical protein O181_020458 [Austropuccinia psidii MF-1]|uniref:Integrase catalytic domain-containing protein n=1 Tax=Austropuccinia psidii MF-1 TaxID=1389203 RepID=A0A9Q3GUI9_9BASI|nr:hypothetical protein [Austropuccinia psidii MF-1]